MNEQEAASEEERPVGSHSLTKGYESKLGLSREAGSVAVVNPAFALESLNHSRSLV